MNADKPDKLAIERFQKLQEKRQALLALEPANALDRILEDPQPAALVHSFPESDFYLLVNDIGPEDALPLLALASNKQWEYITDLEAWNRDRMNLNSITHWLNLLQQADPSRFIRWLLAEKLEFIEFYLLKKIEIRVREHDEDPSDFGKNFFSYDDIYYIRFIGPPKGIEPESIAEKQSEAFLTTLLEKMAEFDHRIYQNLLLEASFVISAETEEEEYRLRNVRLAEKGFLPFDDSVGVYQPIKPEVLGKSNSKYIPTSIDALSLFPVPYFHIRMLKEDSHFTRALSTVATENSLHHIQAEFANLCNQIIVADQKTIREREELEGIVKKACGYINIGLERLAGEKGNIEPGETAKLITHHPLSSIFRVGFGGALELKWKTEKWLASSWFAQTGLRLTFWSEQWLGVLGGLLLKKPLYYDNYKTGALYREFTSLQDIAEAENAFNQVKAVDNLLSLIAVKLEKPSSYGFLTFKNLILTLWAENYLNISSARLEPLEKNKFQTFFMDLFPGGPDQESDQSRKIPDAMKTHFLDWLSRQTGLKDFEITERLGIAFEELFKELENEYGRIAAEDLDPRYVQMFLLK